MARRRRRDALMLALDIERPHTLFVVDGTKADINLYARCPVLRRGIVVKDARPPNSRPNALFLRSRFGSSKPEVALVFDMDRTPERVEFEFHFCIPLTRHAPCMRVTGGNNMHYVSEVKHKMRHRLTPRPDDYPRRGASLLRECNPLQPTHGNGPPKCVTLFTASDANLLAKRPGEVKTFFALKGRD